MQSSSSSSSASNQTLLSSSEPKCVWKDPRECGAADRHPLFFSSCSKNTEWNYFGVAKELKKWVRSVRVVRERSELIVFFSCTYYEKHV